MRVCIDPGHGMGNRTLGKYDPGAVFVPKLPAEKHITEAGIVMEWANELRDVLREHGHEVVRTRVGEKDPAHVSERVGIARRYRCDLMLSLHCNAADGKANGTETFFRGKENQVMAKRITDTLCEVMGTRNRGEKTEAQSQHKRLAVMEFGRCWLIELGFIDHDGDRAKMVDPGMRRKACEALADVIEAWQK